jgi:CHRD domain
MERRWIVLLAAIAAGLLVALPATAAKKKPTPEYDLLAALNGAQERPSAGDPDGVGAADFRIKGNRVCFRIIASGIEPVTAAHIHKGGPEDAGPIEVDLFTFKGKSQTLPPRITGCAKTTTTIAKAIAKKPGDYYVNVHNGPFPGGALRGQLTK